MTAAMLLLAAALVVTPWRSTGVERLRSSVAPGAGASSAPGLPGLPALPAWIRRDPTSQAAEAVLARVLDLLGVALLAGLPTPTALDAVGDAVEPAAPEVAAPLRYVAARVRLGATPAQAWRDVPGAEAVAPVVPALVRATDGGGSVRAGLGHAAQRMRSEADATALARAERAAVLVAGPLGLCFLPAFVCLGIVPVVIGLADGMLPGVLP